jgi:DNA-directed RNA polymerase subunit RPC12/RpoP
MTSSKIEAREINHYPVTVIIKAAEREEASLFVRNMLAEGIRWDQPLEVHGFPSLPALTESAYVHEDASPPEGRRFVALLAVEYGEEEAPSPKHAAELALEITRDASSSETSWLVFERKEGKLTRLDQGDFQDLTESLRCPRCGTRGSLLIEGLELDCASCGAHIKRKEVDND